MAFWNYITARLKEPSTWAAFGVGVSVAAAISAPWSYVAFTCAVIGALVPERGAPHA